MTYNKNMMTDKLLVRDSGHKFLHNYALTITQVE